MIFRLRFSPLRMAELLLLAPLGFPSLLDFGVNLIRCEIRAVAHHIRLKSASAFEGNMVISTFEAEAFGAGPKQVQLKLSKIFKLMMGLSIAATFIAISIGLESTEAHAAGIATEAVPVVDAAEISADTYETIFGESEASAIANGTKADSISSASRKAAENEAARLKVKVKWIPDGQGCGSFKHILGCYIQGNGPEIQLAMRAQKLPAKDARDVVRHEAAHHAIAVMCGTSSPSIIPSGRVENVTNAYAKIYYGMGGREEQITSTDRYVARQIHDEKLCTKEQKPMVVVASDAKLLMWYDNRDYIKHGAAVPLAKGSTVTYYRTEMGFGYVKDSSGRKGFVHLSALTNRDSSTTVASVPVHRFWSPKFANAHFYTADGVEAEVVRANDKNWTYEGSSFRAYPPKNGTCQEGTTGVYRFWSSKFSSHFYTKNASEMKNLRAKDPNWSYEGLMFCEPTSASGNTPVYRFWSPKYQKHFYTANASEMRSLKSNDPAWNYEGIAWYSPKK